jgi:hypothetical protein
MNILIWGIGNCPLGKDLVRKWLKQEASGDVLFLTDDFNHYRDGKCHDDMRSFFRQFVNATIVCKRTAMTLPALALRYREESQWEEVRETITDLSSMGLGAI